MNRAHSAIARTSVPVRHERVRQGARASIRRPAFTLLELLIALSLLVLMGAIAWPLLHNQIAATAIPESSARMRDTLFLARAEAMKEHRRVRVRFAPNEQQPYIEVEKDPIRYPGKWEPVTTSWVKEQPLIDEVQVHTIERGRPAYLKPISFDESSDEAEEDSQEEEEQESTEEFDATMPSATSVNEDVQLDDNRPIIMFEPDGATEWATIKLAKSKLEVELTEEDRQLWVILDGRTGLAYVREPVTEAQLADETFYVKRENLELPKEEGTDDLVLGAQDPNAAANESGGGKFGGPGGSFGGPGGGGGPPVDAMGPGDLAGLPDDIKDRLPGGGEMGRDGQGGGKQGGRGPGGGNGQNGPGRGAPNGGMDGKGPNGGPGSRGPDAQGPKGQGGGKNDDTGGGKGDQPRDGTDNLSDDLNDSDLTDEEQDNITDALNNNSNSNSSNNSNGNTNQNTNSNSNTNTNTNNNSNSNVDNANENLNANKNDNDNLNNNSNKP